MDHVRSGVALAVALSFGTVASAQCQTWRGGFGINGTSHEVRCFAQFDDGSGPALYLGGSFASAGDVLAPNVARWDGERWSRPGNGPLGTVRSFTTWNDGSGHALWAGGDFTTVGGAPAGRIASWNGTTWIASAGGPNAAVNALATFDSGGGVKLYAGGTFTSAAGVSAQRIAVFDGVAWSAPGAGANNTVHALCTFDDGGGPKLYAAGTFTTMDGVAANRIARFDGTSWSALGTGLNNEVRALAVHDFGAGPRLVVGGNFSNAGGVAASCIAVWDGALWSGVGSGTNWFVDAFATFDAGSGPALYAAGEFNSPGNRIVRWNGVAWEPLGVGIGTGTVAALATFGGGGARELFVGGSFAQAGGLASRNVASYDGASWSRLGEQWGPNNNVDDLRSFDDGSGNALFACGAFTAVGAVPMSYVARWNGAAFEALPGGPSSSVRALEVYDSGSGASLYAAGTFSTVGGTTPALGVARWDGTSWSPLPSGVAAGSTVWDLLTFDDGAGRSLFATGTFAAAGGIVASRIARFDGSGWHALGTGLGGDGFALESFDDGSGDALYVGGAFTSAGSVAASRIARWDGSTWSALGEGVVGQVFALESFDDGTGSALYVGGNFTGAGATAAQWIARWNGASWSAMPGLANVLEVRALRVFDDGSGPALYAAGRSTSVLGVPPLFVARWDGASWTSLASAFTTSGGSTISTLWPHDDGVGAGPTLWLGGRFESIDARVSTNLAARQGCSGTGEVFCFGDGSGTACPCGNASAIGDREGCLASTGTGGRLRASGEASLSNDTLLLEGTRMTDGTALYFQGTTRTNGGAGVAFGDGLRCAGGTVIRLDITSNALGASVYPQPGDAAVSVQGAVGAAGTRTYQVWFRDAADFCTASTYDLSNGLEIRWTP